MLAGRAAPLHREGAACTAAEARQLASLALVVDFDSPPLLFDVELDESDDDFDSEDDALLPPLSPSFFARFFCLPFLRGEPRRQ